MVGRLLQDVDGLKVLPQGVNRIGQAAMGERITREQVTELIVYERFGGTDRTRQRTCTERDQRGGGQGTPLVSKHISQDRRPPHAADEAACDHEEQDERRRCRQLNEDIDPIPKVGRGEHELQNDHTNGTRDDLATRLSFQDRNLTQMAEQLDEQHRIVEAFGSVVPERAAILVENT